MNPILNTPNINSPAIDATAGTNKDRLANQDIFMQLLVAQLKYQNPMNPADGIEFMTQLTQFSQLEQTVSIRKELEELKGLVASGLQGTEQP